MAIGKLIIFGQDRIEKKVEIVSRISGSYQSYDDRKFTLKDGIFLPSLLKQNSEGNKQKQYLIDIANGSRNKVNGTNIPKEVVDYIQMYLINQQILVELGISSEIVIHPSEFVILFSRACFKLGFGKVSYDSNNVRKGFFDELPDCFNFIFESKNIIKPLILGDIDYIGFLSKWKENLLEYDINIEFCEFDSYWDKTFHYDLMQQLCYLKPRNIGFDDIFSANCFKSPEVAQQLVLCGLSEINISQEQLRKILDVCGITNSISDIFPNYLTKISKYINK